MEATYKNVSAKPYWRDAKPALNMFFFLFIGVKFSCPQNVFKQPAETCSLAAFFLFLASVASLKLCDKVSI